MLSKPNQSNWDERATTVHSLGIMIAPEVFTAPEDIRLHDKHTVLKGTKYFAWPTAWQLLQTKSLPAGWRFMTPAEGDFICQQYGRSGCGLFVLGLDGIINPNDMVVCNHNPESVHKYVRDRGERGYYWVDNPPDKVYPSIISVSGTRVRMGDSVYMGYGLPLLLVKDL